MFKERVLQIDEQIGDLRTTAREVTRRQEEISLRLAENPTDKTASKELSKLDAELAGINEKVAHLSAARNAAERRDTVDAKAAELLELRAARDLALKAARERADVGAKIDGLLGALKLLLTAWEGLNDQCRAETVKVCIGRMGLDELNARGYLIVAPATAGSGDCGPSLVGGLIEAGLGRTGIPLQGVFPLHIGISKLSLEEAALAEHDRLRARLGEILEE